MRLRKWVSHAVDAFAMTTGYLGRLERRASAGVTVLMYHRVLPESECASYPLSNLAVSERCFARQVKWLARRARVLTAGEAFSTDRARADGRPTVCLTFDDGYADNAEIAAPILEAHGLRATFFVTTAFVERRSMMWFDRAALHWQRVRGACVAASRGTLAASADVEAAASLDDWLTILKTADPACRTQALADLDAADDLQGDSSRFRAMTVAQLRTLHERGHEIGNHTVTHPWLPSVPRSELDSEIAGARALLRQWTGGEIRGFCYPAGDHSEESVAGVRRAGHDYALTTEPGLNTPGADRFLLRRQFVHPSGSTGPLGGPSVLSFRSEIFGLHDRLRRVRRGGGE